MIRFKVIYEKKGEQFTEFYDVTTEQQFLYKFRGKHNYDQSRMIEYRIEEEFEYIIIDRDKNRILNIREKSLNRAKQALKQELHNEVFERGYTIIEVPRDKLTLEQVYPIGSEFTLEWPESPFPKYLSDLGEWKEVNHRKFKRIS